MKTHEFARALQLLARALKNAPNVEVDGFEQFFNAPVKWQASDKIAVNLNTLVELSRIDRHQWLALINQHGFPIELRPRDASRDILGKLLRYLEANPTAREKLRQSVSSKVAQASPELMRALSFLLKD